MLQLFARRGSIDALRPSPANSTPYPSLGAVTVSGIGRRAYSLLRERTPRPLRKPFYTAVEHIGALTNVARSWPHFIIVGGQRCGTNSLYEYLAAHPRIGRALPIQEVHYFDLNFAKGPRWYRGHFPLSFERPLAKSSPTPARITGECSPYYMFHPLAPQRIAATLPNAKILMLLRHPVDRAYSHYQHERSRGIETVSFEEAIDREPDRLAGEVDRMRNDQNYESFNHQHFSYLARGRYIEQVETFFSLFPREQILVLISEQLFSDPAASHTQALRFLDLPVQSMPSYAKHNQGRYTDIDARLRNRITDYFDEYNDRLYRALETDFRWE